LKGEIANDVGGPVVGLDAVQCVLEFGHCCHLHCEPILTAEGGRQQVVAHRGEIVVGVAALAEDVLDAVEAVVEYEDHRFDAVTAHHGELVEGQLV